MSLLVFSSTGVVGVDGSTNFLTNVVFLEYVLPDGDSTITLFPVQSNTVCGVGLNGVVNLFSLSCLTSTWSPGKISEGLAPRRSSAMIFCFPLFSASLSQTS